MEKLQRVSGPVSYHAGDRLLGDRVYKQVRYPAWDQVRVEVRGQVRVEVRDQVEGHQVQGHQVQDRVGDPLRGAARRRIRKHNSTLQ